MYKTWTGEASGTIDPAFKVFKKTHASIACDIFSVYGTATDGVDYPVAWTAGGDDQQSVNPYVIPGYKPWIVEPISKKPASANNNDHDDEYQFYIQIKI